MMNFELPHKFERQVSTPNTMIFLRQTLLNKLIAIAESTEDECCGFIFGNEDGQYRTVTTFKQVENISVKNKKQHFQISSQDYRTAENFADNFNLKLLGVFHSHPNYPALPSEADRMSAQPYFSYFILSLKNKKFKALRSWQLNNNLKFEEESLSIIYTNPQVHGYSNHSHTAA